MAIAITEPVVEVADTSNATSYSTGAFTPTANSLIVIFVFSVSTATNGGMSGGSLIWNQAFRMPNRANSSICFCYWARVGASPSSMTPTFDCSDWGVAGGCMMSTFQVTGHNVDIPIAQFATNVPGANSADPNVTFGNNMNTNNGYMAAIFSQAGTPTVTPPASWTETMDTSIVSPTIGMAAGFREGGETGATITFTAASQNWVMGAIEINAASVLATTAWIDAD